jgi:hypothetical protein
MKTTKFKFCKSVHHHTFQINQLDAKISQAFYLMFIYSPTYFWRPHAHHQGLKNCSSSLWFYRWSVAYLDQQHFYHHAPTVKPEAATAVVELLMMSVRTPKTS